MNRIIFKYDTVTDTLWLDKNSGSIVPVFDPEIVIGTLRKLAESGQPVKNVTQIEINRKSYFMEAVSDDPQKQIKVTITETE